MAKAKPKAKPKKQSRRSISVRGETYKRVTTHCQRAGLTASGFVEQLINDAFERLKAAAEAGSGQQVSNTGKTEAAELRFEQPHELGPKTIENTLSTKTVRGGGTHLL